MVGGTSSKGVKRLGAWEYYGGHCLWFCCVQGKGEGGKEGGWR